MLEPGSLRIILVGCGNMGGAMLEGWLKSALCESVSVINPSRPDILDRYPDAPLHYYSEPEDMPDESYQNADIIILAVKPNKMQQACSALSEKISNNTAVISVAAGITLSSLKQWAGGISAIIRVMPNTPCAIGRGIAVGVSSDSVTDTQKEAATSLMQACGHFEWTEKEETLDAVTALSGSGPAYIFYMIEAMSEAGRSLGLDETLADKLAHHTVTGAAALADHHSGDKASHLRANVTSPGGTTQAALNVLMDGRFRDILGEAMKAARQRSRELSQ